MSKDNRKVTIYLNRDEDEIIVFDETNSKEIANYDWLELNKPYRLEEFIKDIMSLQNIVSYNDLQFKEIH